MNIFSSLLNWSKANEPPPEPDGEWEDVYVADVTVMYSANHFAHGIVHVLYQFTAVGHSYSVVVKDADNYDAFVVRTDQLHTIADHVP